jgi:hypothetical protein
MELLKHITLSKTKLKNNCIETIIKHIFFEIKHESENTYKIKNLVKSGFKIIDETIINNIQKKEIFTIIEE